MPLTLGNLLVIVDITTYVSFTAEYQTALHTTPSTLPVLGLRQRHGAKETQAVCGNENPESVETPIGKHQRR